MNRDRLLVAAAAAALLILLLAFMVTSPSPDNDLPMVYVIYGSEKGDQSYTDSAYRGLFVAQEAMPFVKREFTTLDRPDLSGRLKNPGREKPGLVITVGYTYATDTQQLAEENPDTRFLAIDQSGIGSPNTQAYEITSYGESYLAGVLAASATKSQKVGIILGAESGLLDAFRLGYIDGARAADPSVKVDVAYVSTGSERGFSDPARAAGIARGMYLEGTDVIFTVAGFSGTGAISEAKQAPGRYIIGVDSDQTHLGPSVILASAVKRVDRVVYTGIGEYLNGTFTGGNTVAGLNEGVTGIACNPRFETCNTTVSAWEERAREAEERYLATRSTGG